MKYLIQKKKKEVNKNKNKIKKFKNSQHFLKNLLIILFQKKKQTKNRTDFKISK